MPLGAKDLVFIPVSLPPRLDLGMNETSRLGSSGAINNRGRGRGRHDAVRLALARADCQRMCVGKSESEQTISPFEQT
jgi:hypothetical protein